MLLKQPSPMQADDDRGLLVMGKRKSRRDAWAAFMKGRGPPYEIHPASGTSTRLVYWQILLL